MRTRSALMALVVAVSCAGCSTLEYDVQVDHDPNMKWYETWTWHPRGNRVQLVEPRRTNEAHEKVSAAIERQLSAKQLRKVGPTEAGLLVAFDLGAVPRTQVTEWSEGTYMGRPTSVAMEKKTYRHGSLLIYLIDASTNRLVWRGLAEATADNPDDAASRIDEIVGRLFAKYPS